MEVRIRNISDFWLKEMIPEIKMQCGVYLKKMYWPNFKKGRN
jgi:hypothetical protein